jgi:hypothetical protein
MGLLQRLGVGGQRKAALILNAPGGVEHSKSAIFSAAFLSSATEVLKLTIKVVCRH